MKPTQIAAGVLSLLSLALIARGDAPGTRPDMGANAALKYWPAFDFLPADYNSPEGQILDHWDTVPLDARVDNMLAGSHALLYLHSGAQIPDCDWGLDYTQGPSLLLPQLNRASMLSDYALLRARVEFQQQQTFPAIEDLCDTLAYARHLGSDRILFSRIRQIGIERDAVTFLAAHLKELDAAAMHDLTSRLATLPASASLAEIVEVEGVLRNWYIKQERQSPPDKLRDPFALVYPDPNAQSKIDKAIEEAGGTGDKVVAELTKLQDYYVQMGILIRHHPAQVSFPQQADAIRDTFNDNPFASLLLTDFKRAFDLAAGEETQMVMLNAAIDIVTNGPDKSKDLRDPVNHQPITYNPTTDGFELDSTLTVTGKPVILKIGH